MGPKSAAAKAAWSDPVKRARMVAGIRAAVPHRRPISQEKRATIVRAQQLASLRRRLGIKAECDHGCENGNHVTVCAAHPSSRKKGGPKA